MNKSRNLIDIIKKDNVKPIPKWRFTLKSVIIWSGFIISVIFGALAFSVILFAIQQLDFDLVAHMSHSRFEFLLGLMPFFWIVTLIIFLIMAMVSIKNSKKGYKFSAPKVMAFSVSLSILAGTMFFIAGGGKWLESAFAVNVSLYESIQEKKTRLWMLPEEGYLSGTIESVTSDSLYFMDFNGEPWTVLTGEADISPSVSLREGESLKLIGTMLSESRFQAEKIRPWGGLNRFNKQIE